MVQTKKFPFLLLLSFIFVLGVGLAYGYYASQTQAVEQQLQSIEQELAEVNNQLDQLQQSEVVSAQNAISTLDAVEKAEISWSEVLDLLQDIAPKDNVALRAMVEFTSYSGAEGGRITLNAQTYPSRDVRKLLNAVAKTIENFNENPDFEEVFVPSISKSVSEDQETVLSFILSVAYRPSYEQAASSDEEDAVARR
ncbi:hypothetical protein GF369_01920 [Candidatus Peregrinibacteria bacterium]|nr:hypothetical protein [Candidatus Peregrinibacteria bacterium]